MSQLFKTDSWINAGLHKANEQPDFEGMQRVADALSLPRGRIMLDEHAPLRSRLDHYGCRTTTQVAMLPQRIHEERLNSYLTAYFLKPLALLLVIATLVVTIMALDRYSRYRLGSWYEHLQRHDCISPGSDQIVRDTARCGQLDLMYGQRLQWPIKTGIVVGISILSAVAFFVIMMVSGQLLLFLFPGPGIHEVRFLVSE